MTTMNKPTTTDLSKSLMDIAAVFAEWSRVLPSVSREEAFDLFAQFRIPLFEGAELRVVMTGAGDGGEATGAGPNDLVYNVPGTVPAHAPAHVPATTAFANDVSDTGSDYDLDLGSMSPPGLTRAGSVSDTSSTGPSTPIELHADLPVFMDASDTNDLPLLIIPLLPDFCDDDRGTGSAVGGDADQEFDRLEREWRRSHPTSLDGSRRDSRSPSPDLADQEDVTSTLDGASLGSEGSLVNMVERIGRVLACIDDLSNSSLRDDISQGPPDDGWYERECEDIVPEGWDRDRHNDYPRDSTPTSDEWDEEIMEGPEDIYPGYHASDRDMNPPSELGIYPPGFSERSSSKRSSPSLVEDEEEEDGQRWPKRRRTPEYQTLQRCREPSPRVASSSRLPSPPPRALDRRRPRNRRSSPPPVASSSRIPSLPGNAWNRRRCRHQLTPSPEPFFEHDNHPRSASSRHRLPSPHPARHTGYPAPEDDLSVDDNGAVVPASYMEDTRRPPSAERYYGDYYQHDSPPRYESEAIDGEEGDELPVRLVKIHHDDCQDFACVDGCPIYVRDD